MFGEFAPLAADVIEGALLGGSSERIVNLQKRASANGAMSKACFRIGSRLKDTSKQIGARSSQLQQPGSSHSLRARYIERQEGHSIAPAPAAIAAQFGRKTARPRKTDWRMKMARKMCEVCRIMPASAFIDVVDCGQRRKLPVCNSHRTRLYGPSDDELAAIVADVRLDAELADSFPASDPPSILRGGLKDA